MITKIISDESGGGPTRKAQATSKHTGKPLELKLETCLLPTLHFAATAD